MAVRARSPRIPVLIMLFNGILAAAALLNMYSSIVQVRISNTIRYESFLQLYAFVATLEFLLLMFIMPALTSASISGERERHTLELMFTTRLRAADIVAGKLMSALPHGHSKTRTPGFSSSFSQMLCASARLAAGSRSHLSSGTWRNHSVKGAVVMMN